MNRAQALSKARKLFGRTAVVRDDGHYSSPEMRESARALLKELRAAPLADRSNDYRTREKRLIYWSLYHRCAVGRIALGLFFDVMGEGDNFAEAIDAAERKLVSGRV